MGKILRFQPPGLRPGQVAEIAASSAGDVVIFPGVRIERHDIDLASRLRQTVREAAASEIEGGRPRRTS
jgi:hypothetical protein